MKLKCLFVGVFHKESTNYSQAIALEKLGVDVNRFEYRKIARDTSPEHRDQVLVSNIQLNKPDFVLTAKGTGISAEVLYETVPDTKHILWYMDPLNSNFDKELCNRMEACHAVVCAWEGPRRQAMRFHNKVFRVAEGFDEAVDHPIDTPKIHKVSFIGNVDVARQEYLDTCHGQIDAWSEIHMTNKAFGEKHARVVSESDINLNFTRKGGTSDRVYKVLAAGGFLLTQEWPGMLSEFSPGMDFATFTDIADMCTKIDFYLEHKEERQRIAKNGHASVQAYTRTEWARAITDIAKGLL